MTLTWNPFLFFYGGCAGATFFYQECVGGEQCERLREVAVGDARRRDRLVDEIGDPHAEVLGIENEPSELISNSSAQACKAPEASLP